MRVIGTAGHVDHGKSTLIKALTGIDPDRLREEKERGMTIDLGFAWLRLPSGQEASVVDVPGHERFIHNMLAGVAGIDIALLVVAADEGIMPQTREHLAILDLLGITRGVVAITKRELVDEEWLELVTAEVEETLAGTSLAGSPIIALSAVAGQHLDDLLAALDHLLQEERTRRVSGKPRLPIDRVFTMPGFGTVVTGTLVDGELTIAQELEVQPGGRKVRIRGLQAHKKKVTTAPAGTRVAVNLSGLDRDELRRGQVLAAPKWLTPTRRVDVKLRLVRDLPKPLAHNTLVTFHTGTAEASGRVRLLDSATLEAGQTGWAQLWLAEEVAVAKGDLFIVRLPSPSLTLGGGSIVEPHPKLHRRFQPRVLEELTVLERGTPDEIVLQQLQARQPTDVDSLLKRSGLAPDQARQVLANLVDQGNVIALDGASGSLGPQTLVVTQDAWQSVVAQVRQSLAEYHARFPLRRGMPREEVRARVKAEARFFGRLVELLVRQGELSEEGPLLRLAEHRIQLSEAEQRQADALIDLLRRHGASPPSPREFEAALGLPAELLRALIERGDLVEVAPDAIYDRQTYNDLVEQTVATIRQHGSITVAQARDLFNTSRKFALALLSHLDEQRVTRRVGDERVLY